MQSVPMYLGSSAAAPHLGSAAVVQPSLHQSRELDHSARLRLLAQPMKIELPASLPPPRASRAPRAPPGLEQQRPPQGAFALLLPPGASAPPSMPPGAFATPPGAFGEAVCYRDGSDCCSTSAEQDGETSEASAEVEECTTMAILNIPYTYPKWKLQAQMESMGYTFNYFHFPKDSRKGRNRGFAFVNFTMPEIARAFRLKFDNMPLFHPREDEKPITVVPSSLQGLDGNRALHPGAAARPLKQMTRRK